MKKTISRLICLVMLLTLCGCTYFQDVGFQGSMDIPEDGIISAELIGNLKDHGAVAVFAGESNGYHYEWTLFGSDISAVQPLNLKAEIRSAGDLCFTVHLFSTADTVVSAVLSVRQKTVWNAQNATVYRDGSVCASATITGTDTSVINFTVSDLQGTYTVKAGAQNTDGEPESAVAQTTTDRTYSDDKATGRDKYQTDPVPEGKPMPAEPEDQSVNESKQLTCTFSIECTTILNNLSRLGPEKLEVLPKNGIILQKQTVIFCEGESVYDVSQRVCRENGIHMEASFTPLYNSAYVEGIHNLYEFDCGNLSGWMYRVNGWYPNYGCSRYALAEGDTVEWRYTCDLGKDVGRDRLSSEADR